WEEANARGYIEHMHEPGTPAQVAVSAAGRQLLQARSVTPLPLAGEGARCFSPCIHATRPTWSSRDAPALLARDDARVVRCALRADIDPGCASSDRLLKIGQSARPSPWQPADSPWSVSSKVALSCRLAVSTLTWWEGQAPTGSAAAASAPPRRPDRS